MALEPQPALSPAADAGKSEPEERSKLAALLVPIVLFALVFCLATLLISGLLGRFYEGAEWQALATVIEQSTALKAGLAVLFSLFSVAIGVFSKIHTAGRTLQATFWMLVGAIGLSLVLLLYTSQGESPRAAVDYWISEDFCPLGTEGTDADKAAARHSCIARSLFGFWIAVTVWFGMSLATVLGLRSEVMNKLRAMAGQEAVGPPTEGGGNG